MSTAKKHKHKKKVDEQKDLWTEDQLAFLEEQYSKTKKTEPTLEEFTSTTFTGDFAPQTTFMTMPRKPKSMHGSPVDVNSFSLLTNSIEDTATESVGRPSREYLLQRLKQRKQFLNLSRTNRMASTEGAMNMSSLMHGTAKSKIPNSMDDLCELAEKTVGNPHLFHAHIGLYGSYILKNLDLHFKQTDYPENFLLWFRFNVTCDPVFQKEDTKTLEILLVLRQKIIYCIHDTTFAGLQGLDSDKLLCAPTNILKILPDANRDLILEAFRVTTKLDQIARLTDTEFGLDGFPCIQVIENKTWKSFPVTKAVLDQFRTA